MKEILLIGATHGDEPLGVQVIERLIDLGFENYFDVLIGNPKALNKNLRYLEFDLNRAYPGDPNSPFFEKRLAYDNLKIAQKYKYIIHIHEASKGLDDFIIVPRNEIGKCFPVNCLTLGKVLLWPTPKGPLGDVLENCVELEFGSKGRNRGELIEAGVSEIMSFIKALRSCTETPKNKEIFTVYGSLKTEDYKEYVKMRDFELTHLNGEAFYPLLVDQYLAEGIKCYKMKKENV